MTQKLFYDLHIHSCLSPCGDNDMTPNNIVNMALLKGLDIIAVSDHNSCKNARAVINAAGSRLLVIPAMEITTAEEVHMLSLFPSLEAAEGAGEYIRKSLPSVKNRPEIFGNQYIMDKNDEIIGDEDTLLIGASSLDLYGVCDCVKSCGGLFVPAHIDRSSYSILSNLGFLPPDIFFPCVEITARGLDAFSQEYTDRKIITDSDAHYLWDISEKERFLELEEKSTEKVFESLCKLP